jgi:Uma2 family endonuclease
MKNKILLYSFSIFLVVYGFFSCNNQQEIRPEPFPQNLGIEEYWIVDVQTTKIIAFAIADGGSKRIYQSVVLPSLEIHLLENALQKTRQENHSKVGAWLLQIFQS